LRHLQAAFSNFFAGRAKYPNFKKKRNGGSAEFTKSAFKWKDRKLFLAKCTEPLNIRWSRQLPDGVEPSTVTVRLNPAGQWYVSLRFADPRDLRLKPAQQSVGLDAGISSLITLSTGEKVANPKHFDRHYSEAPQGSEVFEPQTERLSQSREGPIEGCQDSATDF
jgi:putative transposase